MHRSFLFVALLLANTAGAATQFRFVEESTGDPIHPRTAGVIRVDGESYRIDYEGPIGEASSVFSTDGGRTVTSLNSELETYWIAKKSDHPPSSRLYLGVEPTLVRKPPVVTVKDVVLREEPTDERIAGYQTRKFTLPFSHDVKLKVGSEKIRIIYHSKVELWTTEKLDLPFLPMDPRQLFTQQVAVDPVVREALSAVKGFPLKRRLELTRQFDGFAVAADVVTTTFDDFKTVDLPAEALAVPSGYREQKPIVTSPGVDPASQ